MSLTGFQFPVNDVYKYPQWRGKGGGSSGYTLGPELITNGNFGEDTDWTKGLGWTIDTYANTDGQKGNLIQSVGIVSAKNYRLAFLIKDEISVVAGLGVRIGTLVNQQTYSGEGWKVGIFTAGVDTTNIEFVVTAAADFVGAIGFVSLKEVL